MMKASKVLLVLICSAVMCGLFPAPALPSGTHGYAVAIPCQYEGSVSQFYSGVVPAGYGNKQGLLDKQGNIVAPFEYDSVFAGNSLIGTDIAGYFTAIKNGKWGVLDKTGKLVVACKYDSVWMTGTSLAIVGKGTPVPPGGGTIEGLWGLVDLQTGEEILPVKYKGISESADPLYFIVNLDGKSGVTDRAGKFIVPIGVYDFIGHFNSGLASVQKNGKWGVIDKSGKLVIPLAYDLIDRFYQGRALAAKGNKYGVIGTSGETVHPFIYNDGGVGSNGSVYLKRNGKITIFDNTGKVIAPSGKYNYVYEITGNLIYVERSGKVGAIDMTGKEVVPPVYTGIKETKNGLAAVINNDKAAVINQSGKVILPLDRYGNINLRDDGCILVVLATNYKQGLIDSNGRTVLPYEYDSIGPIQDGYVSVANQQGMALFNRDGEMIVPFGEFDYINYHISENMVGVVKDGLIGYLSLPEYVAPPDDWAKPEVERAIAAGLVPENMRRGYRDNITRADFCRLVINLIETKTGMKIDVFIDTRGMSGRVADNIVFADTYDPAVIAASRLGIVKGVGNSRFDPTGTIRRQDAAVMLQRTANLLDLNEPNSTPMTFADSDKFPAYAAEAIAFVSALADRGSGNRVMGGTGNNCFSPLGTYTRQQAYLTILRLNNSFE